MTNPWDILPAQFLDVVREITPPERLNEVLESFTLMKPPTFRTNTLKISTSDLEKELNKLGIKHQKVPWYNDGFILLEEQRILTETDLYKNGFLYIQSLSSMIPALILDPGPDDKVLDITAAPGSKTTQMAAMMKNSGEILANDLSRVRLYKLGANLKGQGITNTKISHGPGQKIWEKYPEYFDKTLVDVPCSLEGRFLCSYPKSFRDWTPKKVKILSQIQKFLLRAAISSTKVGGTIVYSTCTLEVDENEAVIDWILEKEGGKIKLLSIDLNLPTQKGISTYKGKSLNKEVEKTLRILPSKQLEGFFIAKFKKISTNLG